MQEKKEQNFKSNRVPRRQFRRRKIQLIHGIHGRKLLSMIERALFG